MKAHIEIRLKHGVLDPQGKAVEEGLSSLGFSDVSNVRVGKLIEMDLGNVPEAEAEAHVKNMCEQLLANTVIESYQINIVN